MAKKKKEEAPAPGSPAWMATFSDLMNLLLCFFVLLFSMSSVDADKWEQVVASFQNSFSILSGGETSIGDGFLISMGTSQLNDLDEYFSQMGQRDDEDEGEKVKEQQTFDEILAEANIEETTQMLDNVAQLTEAYNLTDFLELAMDPSGKYVEIIISGSVLFDSGKAEIREEALPVLSKLGDILSVYDKNHSIDIIGHTDNVPMKSEKYESNDILSSARAISAARYLVENKDMDINSLSWTGRGEHDPIASNSTPEGRAKNRRIEIRIYNSISSDN